MKSKSKNYHAFSQRIKDADGVDTLKNLEKRTENFYNLGLLTVSEFRALDLMIFDRLAKASI